VSIIRNLTFTVGLDSISPGSKQYAGVQGEHCSTNLVFVLDDVLASSEYIYRVEMVDSMNNYQTTETMVLEPGSRELTVSLTRAWTQSAGLCEVRVVVAKLDAEFNELLIHYTEPALIYFKNRAEGVYQEQEIERNLTALIEEVKNAADKALESSMNADQFSLKACTASETALTAANNANEAASSAYSAGVFASSAGNSAENYAQLANSAAVNANNAAANAISAADYANQMAQAALSAANTANEGEVIRQSAEAVRAAAEQGRIEAEYQRTEAENLRVQAENQRQASFAQFESRITTLESGKADKADIYLKQEVDAAFAQTNLRVAEIGKDLSDYKAVLSQLNPNQEAKQTISDYGIVPLPVNAANGHMDVAVGGNTEINENGMYHTVSAMRIVSESEDETRRTELYIPDVGELRSLPNGVCDEISDGQLIQRVKTLAITAQDIRGLGTAGVNVDWVVISKPTDYIGYGTSAYATGTIIFGNYTEKRISTLDLPENINCISSFGPETFYLVIPKDTYADLNAAKTALAGTKLTYQLAEPIITPINVSGTLLSYPKGTVFAEPVLPVAGIYTDDGITVTNTNFPIGSIERIYKIDFATGVETPIDVSKVVVAGNGLGFTHPDLADGDIVFFTYYYSNTGTQPKISATYFDSRYVLKDTVTGKFYKKVETVQNGQLTTQLVEVS